MSDLIRLREVAEAARNANPQGVTLVAEFAAPDGDGVHLATEPYQWRASLRPTVEFVAEFGDPVLALALLDVAEAAEEVDVHDLGPDGVVVVALDTLKTSLARLHGVTGGDR